MGGAGIAACASRILSRRLEIATVDQLNDVAEAFLAAAVAALAMTDAGAPGRAFVSPGEPALDCCGQCSVWNQTLSDVALAGGSGALSPAKKINRGTQPTILLLIQTTRCQIGLGKLGEGELPKPEDLSATAQMTNQDVWALRCHLMSELRHGVLAQICSGAEYLGSQALVPQGGCVGWTTTFRYPIEGGIISP
jgi:hypothetical protein